MFHVRFSWIKCQKWSIFNSESLLRNDFSCAINICKVAKKIEALFSLVDSSPILACPTFPALVRRGPGVVRGPWLERGGPAAKSVGFRFGRAAKRPDFCRGRKILRTKSLPLISASQLQSPKYSAATAAGVQRPFSFRIYNCFITYLADIYINILWKLFESKSFGFNCNANLINIYTDYIHLEG